MLALVIVGSATGLFHCQHFPDSKTYIAAADMPWAELLSYRRTLGYPLLLKAVAPFSPDFAVMPWVHLAMFCVAILLLDTGLRRYGASSWQAFAVSTGVFYGALQDQTIGALLSDFPAIVTAVIAIACLFSVAAAPRRPLPWIGLTLSLALCYHIRPAYLFLIALVPCLGILLSRLRTAGTEIRWRWKPYLLALTSVSVVPYLGYCLLRLVAVGHFGLVSFGGYHVAGIAVEMLNDQMVQTELPAEWRPLATEMLKRRREQGMTSVFRDYGVIEFRRWELLYNQNIKRVALASAVHVYGDDWVVANRKLGQFAHCVIGLRKPQYLLFLAYSYPRAVARLVYCSGVVKLFVAMTLALFAARVVICHRRRNRSGEPADRHPSLPAVAGNGRRSVLRDSAVGVVRLDNGSLGHRPSISTEPTSGNLLPGRLRWALLWLAGLFFLAKMSLVIPVVIAQSRYVFPASIFVPSVLCLWMLDELTAIRRTLAIRPQNAGRWLRSARGHARIEVPSAAAHW
jgi:hypothetical protein